MRPLARWLGIPTAQAYLLADLYTPEDFQVEASLDADLRAAYEDMRNHPKVAISGSRLRRLELAASGHTPPSRRPVPRTVEPAPRTCYRSEPTAFGLSRASTKRAPTERQERGIWLPCPAPQPGVTTA